MVGPKMQAFCHDHAMLKGNRCILRIRGAPACQKVPKSYFQIQFSMSKIDSILKIQWFPLSILIFGQKSCFLGPIIFKIPQPN